MVEPGESTYLEVALGDKAAEECPLGQANPLLVLGQPFDAEFREQDPEVRLHGVDRQEELIGDLLIGGRAGERGALLVGAAERHQNAALGGRSGARR